jgi:hypothetical protein
MKKKLSAGTPPSDGKSTYQRMRADMRNVVALLNATFPHAGDDFAKQLHFDDARETVYYIGGDRLKPEPNRKPLPLPPPNLTTTNEN